ncbi:MAG: right-handed parallel beta-helix repeat-containing protein [Thermoplasmatota archaeon]
MGGKRNRTWIAIITLSLLIALPFLMSHHLREVDADLSDPERLVSHGDIDIKGEEELKNETAISAGNGTREDPYVIRDLWINWTSPIRIRDTRSHILIENCYLADIVSPYGSRGVYLSNASNVTVRNCRVTDMDTGIYAFRSHNLTIENCTVKNGTGEGMAIFHCTGSRIEQNDISYYQTGMAFRLSSNPEVVNNRIHNCTIEGIRIDETVNGTIQGNTIEYCFNGIFFLKNNGMNLTYNHFLRCGLEFHRGHLKYISTINFGPQNTVNGDSITVYLNKVGGGVSLIGRSQIIVYNCTDFGLSKPTLTKTRTGLLIAGSTGCRFGSITGEGGIQIVGSTDISLTDIKLETEGPALDVYESNGLIVTKCRFLSRNATSVVVERSDDGFFMRTNSSSNSSNGAFCLYSDGAVFLECNFSGCNNSGIELQYSDGITIRNSKIVENHVGINVSYGGTDLLIEGNNISHNTGKGLNLKVFYSGSVISNNSFYRNGEYGIYLDPTHQGYLSPLSIDENLFIENRIGIFAGTQYNHRIIANEFRSNLEEAIYSIYSSLHGGENTYHHNGFFNNNGGLFQVYSDVEGEKWDDGDGAGNYWSDYTDRYPLAQELEGYWSQPCSIQGEGENLDHYPLIRWTSDDVEPEPPEPPRIYHPPMIGPLFPSDRIYTRTDLELEFSITDMDGTISSVTSYFIYKDSNITIEPVMDGELCSISISVEQLAEGNGILFLQAVDNEGNQTTYMVQIYVDRTPPSAEITPEVLEFEAGEYFTLHAYGSYDNLGISNTTWELEYGEVIFTYYLPRWKLIFTEPVNISVTLTVQDKAGNSHSVTRTITIYRKHDTGPADDDDPFPDIDGDGLSDDWEMLYQGNLSLTPEGDPDRDGFTNREEFLLGTDPGSDRDPMVKDKEEDDKTPTWVVVLVISMLLLTTLSLGAVIFLLVRRLPPSKPTEPLNPKPKEMGIPPPPYLPYPEMPLDAPESVSLAPPPGMETVEALVDEDEPEMDPDLRDLEEPKPPGVEDKLPKSRPPVEIPPPPDLDID